MRFDSVAKWLTWQESLHPFTIDLGLDRVADVYQQMGLDKPAPIVISVAGTNGKGSSVAMLSAILTAAGYRVGCYTSPHLLRYNERISVGEQNIDDEALCRAFDHVDTARTNISLTYFEFGTLAALSFFSSIELDVVVLEVGLGGRLDAVNVVDSDVALITAIGIDHQQWLGESRESIAGEKAGIMRTGRPWVCSDPAPPKILFSHANELEAPGYILGQEFSYERDKNSWSWKGPSKSHLNVDMPRLEGGFQLQNAAGVLQVLDLLETQLHIEHDAINSGLNSVSLPGRYQRLAGGIDQIVDVAHNPHAAQALASALADDPCGGKTLAVVAMLIDKDIAGVLSALLEQVDEWYLGSLDVPRGAHSKQLKRYLQDAHTQSPIMAYNSVTEAHIQAMENATKADRIVIFGSFFTVAEVLPNTGT